jgi:hypothetical protein
MPEGPVRRRLMIDVWPVQLEKPLPFIPIPLWEGDADVALDLQQAFSMVYEIIGYNERVDYTQQPTTPLTPTGAAWFDERLRRAGRRGA